MAALWGSVKTIMKIRATRAESWGNQSVLAVCKQKLCNLNALALDSLLMLYTPTGYASPERHTLSSLAAAKYFIPFWPEHILDLCKINVQEAHSWAWGLVCGSLPQYIPPQHCPTIDQLESAKPQDEGLNMPNL
jgi:hypothetical protein